jgi:uncharacterized protein
MGICLYWVKLEINLARPVENRIVKNLPGMCLFKPQGIPAAGLEVVQLTIDEYEAIRLADLEGMYQEQASQEMQISRQTFGRILESAHSKLADAIIHGKLLRIGGGNYCIEGPRTFTCGRCKHRWLKQSPEHDPRQCPRCSKHRHGGEAEDLQKMKDEKHTVSTKKE